MQAGMEAQRDIEVKVLIARGNKKGIGTGNQRTEYNDFSSDKKYKWEETKYKILLLFMSISIYSIYNIHI